MREVVFRVLAERPGQLEAQSDTLPIRITAPTLEELQHEARGGLIEHLGWPTALIGFAAPQPRRCCEQHPSAGAPAALCR